MIVLKDICKSYFNKELETPVLHHIDLEVKQGEFVILYGNSGSGKTSLLNIIGLIDKPTSGSYLFEDAELTAMSEKKKAVLRNKKFGFIFQAFYLIPELNVLENVCVPAGYAGIQREKRIARAEQLLEDVGLEDKKNSMPSRLSGGEKQRVAIARALMNDPDIIIADEPTGNLDSRNGKNIMELIKKKHIEGKTVIMVTHDNTLKFYATRVLHLADGQLVSTELTPSA